MRAPDTISEELKHLKHVGLRQNPFPVAPDNVNFFISDYIDRVTSNIVHGIFSRKGFLVLTGDIGLGKTTISRRIINVLEKKAVETSLVFHTSFQDVELLREINRDFGLECASLRFSDQMKVLNDFLLDCSRKGKNCAIIIDDAQNLSGKSLELVRMISNLEADQQKLVQILLIGQPELMDRLNQNALRQLKSRIIIWEAVRPLTSDELKYYLLYKLNASGGSGKFSVNKGALKKIYKITRGNFRSINILMDRCLYVAFLQNTHEISKQVVAAAHSDLFPPKFKLRMPRWATVAMLATFVSISLIGGLLDAASNRRFATKPMVVRKKILHRIPVTTKSAARAKAGPGDPIGDFLSAYRLSNHKDAFTAALHTGRFENLADTIFKQTGYKLIRLETLPDYIRGKYGTLSYPINAEGELIHFILWRPQLTLKKFHHSYRGAEIVRLQNMLAQLRLYTYRQDGIVGKRLVNALTRFQKRMTLPVTGFPDERTLFLLCHQRGVQHG